MRPKAGGPPGLHRLAVDTGGRITKNTNDLSLGIARAERDLACRYTIGVYDRNVVEDVPRDIVIKVRRPGLRVLQPSAYLFRSRSARRGALLKAAFMAPDMFSAGVIRAHVFPLRPAGKKAWECLAAVDFPVAAVEGPGSAEREFGAVIRQGTDIVHQSSRRVTLRAKSDGGMSERRVSFLDRAVLDPGEYEITAVLTSPEAETPFTARVRVAVPAVPRKVPFLVGPYLGYRAGRDVVIHAERTDPKAPERAAVENPKDRIGTAASFEPLLIWRVPSERDLLAFTLACEPRKRRSEAAATVRRALRGPDGAQVGTLPDVPFSPEGEGGLRCQPLVDLLPIRALPAGRYAFAASFDPPPRDAGESTTSVSFTIEQVQPQ